MDEIELDLDGLKHGSILRRIATALEALVPQYRECKDCGAWKDPYCFRDSSKRNRGEVEHFRLEDDGCAESIPKPPEEK